MSQREILMRRPLHRSFNSFERCAELETLHFSSSPMTQPLHNSVIQSGECPMVVSLRLYLRRSSLVAPLASRAHSFGLCTCSSLRVEEGMFARCTFASFCYALSGRSTFLLCPHMVRLFGVNSSRWWRFDLLGSNWFGRNGRLLC